MTMIRVSFAVVADKVFGASARPVRILNAEFDPLRREFSFEIEGDDVPDVPHVIGICNVQQNRAGQRLETLTFKAVE